MTGTGRLPDFVVAGVPRSGTTTLAAHLRALDDVFLPGTMEPHFFTQRRERGEGWYRGLYRDARPDQLCGDITPAYLVHPGAIADMARTLSDPTVVVVLRDPIDRAYSHYWLNQWKGAERKDFEGALDAEPERLRRRPDFVPHAYVRSGEYAALLRNLYEHVPAERVKVVVFDDLVADPRTVVAGVCEHIGAAPVTRPVEKQRANHHGPVRSVRVGALAQHLPGPLCQAVRRWNTSPGEYPPMAEHTRSRLLERFAADHDDLVGLLGRPLPWGATVAD